MRTNEWLGALAALLLATASCGHLGREGGALRFDQRPPLDGTCRFAGDCLPPDVCLDGECAAPRVAGEPGSGPFAGDPAPPPDSKPPDPGPVDPDPADPSEGPDDEGGEGFDDEGGGEPSEEERLDEEKERTRLAKRNEESDDVHVVYKVYKEKMEFDFEDDDIEGALLKPDGEYLSSKTDEPPPPRTRTAFPTMEAPPSVPVGRSFSLLVSLTEEQITPEVRVSSGSTDDEGRLDLAALGAPDPNGWNLDVVLSAPGFELEDGVNQASIQLPVRGDSTPARFVLTARPIEDERRKRSLYATLWYRGAFVARVARDIEVRSAQATAAREAEKTTAGAPAAARPVDTGNAGAATIGPLLDRGYEPPSLTVYVRRPPDAEPETASLTLVSPDFQPTESTFPLPRALPSWLDQEYARFAGMSTRGGRRIGKEPEATKKVAIARMEAFGDTLWRRFAPEAFKDVFWRLRDTGRLTSIQIYTDDPVLPWELMRPSRDRPDGGREELDFLGIEVSVARWHVSAPGKVLERPPRAQEMRQVTAIVPRYDGQESLPGQEREVEALARLHGFREVPGRLPRLVGLLSEEPRGIIHFAGHGVLRRGPSGLPTYAMRLEDDDLDVMTWRGLSVDRGHHPLYFLNACDLGQADRAAGFVDGWAPAVLESGASGYIGGLWPLGDAGAATFAAHFYLALSSALNVDGAARVAQLVQRARRDFYKTGDPTALAYVFYGDAQFRFLRDQE